MERAQNIAIATMLLGANMTMKEFAASANEVQQAMAELNQTNCKFSQKLSVFLKRLIAKQGHEIVCKKFDVPQQVMNLIIKATFASQQQCQEGDDDVLFGKRPSSELVVIKDEVSEEPQPRKMRKSIRQNNTGQKKARKAKKLPYVDQNTNEPLGELVVEPQTRIPEPPKCVKAEIWNPQREQGIKSEYSRAIELLEAGINPNVVAYLFNIHNQYIFDSWFDWKDKPLRNKYINQRKKVQDKIQQNIPLEQIQKSLHLRPKTIRQLLGEDFYVFSKLTADQKRKLVSQYKDCLDQNLDWQIYLSCGFSKTEMNKIVKEVESGKVKNEPDCIQSILEDSKYSIEIQRDAIVKMLLERDIDSVAQEFGIRDPGLIPEWSLKIESVSMQGQQQ